MRISRHYQKYIFSNISETNQLWILDKVSIGAYTDCNEV